jgi:hypothetical protein
MASKAIIDIPAYFARIGCCWFSLPSSSGAMATYEQAAPQSQPQAMIRARQICRI